MLHHSGVGEVSGDFGRRRHVGQRLAGLAVAPTVIPARKERLILDDRTGNDRAELVLAECRGTSPVHVLNRVAGIEEVVAHVFESRAVEGVGP